VTSLRDSKTFPLAPPPALPYRAFTCRRSAAGICNDRPQSRLSKRFFRPFGARPLCLLGTHDLRRGLHSFAASRLGYFAATIESHGGVRWDGETVTQLWREKRPLGLKPARAWHGTLPWKGRSSTVVYGAIGREWCMDQLCTRQFLYKGRDSFAPSELDSFAAWAPRLASWAAIFRRFAAGL
jgi:hypothetical protein